MGGSEGNCGGGCSACMLASFALLEVAAAMAIGGTALLWLPALVLLVTGASTVLLLLLPLQAAAAVVVARCRRFRLRN